LNFNNNEGEETQPSNNNYDDSEPEIEDAPDKSQDSFLNYDTDGTATIPYKSASEQERVLMLMKLNLVQEQHKTSMAIQTQQQPVILLGDEFPSPSSEIFAEDNFTNFFY
jgi:hypothetical protein